MEYKGYQYLPDEEVEKGVIKIWHMVLCPDGTTMYVDFNPYTLMTKEDFELWIDLEFPTRFGIAPLDSEELKQIAVAYSMAKGIEKKIIH